MNIKALIEQRNALVGEMETLANAASDEVRAFTEAEQTRYDELKAEVAKLDTTIKAISEQAQRSLTKAEPQAAGDGADAETRAFVEYIRTGDAQRADFDTGSNGAVIPTSIANKIISKVHELSPVFALATKYNVGGTLNIPYYDEETQQITVAYADEFSDLTSSAGKFTSISLGSFLAGALCKISRKLINQSQFDVLGYIINQIAIDIAAFVEGELLNGTADKIEGLSGATQVVTAAASSVVTADELIELQESVPDIYQSGAIWVMSRATRTAIRKLKDGDGNYLLNRDATAKWGYSLFGKPVYVSEKAGELEAGGTAVYYGDFSGLAVKISEEVNMQVLTELYAAQHVVGVVAWLDMDAKIENQQKLAVLKMASA